MNIADFQGLLDARARLEDRVRRAPGRHFPRSGWVDAVLHSPGLHRLSTGGSLPSSTLAPGLVDIVHSKLSTILPIRSSAAWYLSTSKLRSSWSDRAFATAC